MTIRPVHLPPSPEPIRPTRPQPAADTPRAVAPQPQAASPGDALWELLTPEERAFFQDHAALGPLTYGPRRAAFTPTLPAGSRIDVKG